MDLTILPTTLEGVPADGFIVQGDGSGAAGNVSGAGDVNGDGFADLIVGSMNGTSESWAYVLFGGAFRAGLGILNSEISGFSA